MLIQIIDGVDDDIDARPFSSFVAIHKSTIRFTVISTFISGFCTCFLYFVLVFVLRF
jgi:hypothetical protein